MKLRYVVGIIVFVVIGVQKLKLFTCVWPFVQIYGFYSSWVFDFLSYNAILIMTFIRNGFTIIVCYLLQSMIISALQLYQTIIPTLQLYQIILYSIGCLCRLFYALQLIGRMWAPCVNIILIVIRSDSWQSWYLLKHSIEFILSVYHYILYIECVFIEMFNAKS